MIRVAVVEEHQVLIDALEFVMRLEKEYEFEGGASTYSAGLSLVKAALPHVLLVDINMPEGSGLEFVASVKAYSPATRMIVFIGMVDKETVLRAVDLGVVGLVHKGCTLSELITTIGKASHDGLLVAWVSLRVAKYWQADAGTPAMLRAEAKLGSISREIEEAGSVGSAFCAA